MGNKKFKIKSIKFKVKLILVLIFVFSIFGLKIASAYSLDNPTKSLESLFNKNPFDFSPIDLGKFTKSDRYGLTFSDLTNIKSFSSQDVGASIKAVLILFIKLIITTLNVTLGILKALLEVLNKVI